MFKAGNSNLPREIPANRSCIGQRRPFDICAYNVPPPFSAI
ncbi:hypothetical protein CES86_2051 [Brucella lupini]|uniref:Uncharacterized protein n=1 Tax=Brucella lupini TaxID=255457 RepID=A0A256GR62_9HYPH|nr:hypothetical protein CES86_2051 [Brucella lupini]